MGKIGHPKVRKVRASHVLHLLIHRKEGGLEILQVFPATIPTEKSRSVDSKYYEVPKKITISIAPM